MASTIDQISSLAHPSWREAVRRTAKERILPTPDTQMRSRQVGLVVVGQLLLETTRTSGIAAYARQQQVLSQWREANESQPVRTVTAKDWHRSTSIGSVLDVKL